MQTRQPNKRVNWIFVIILIIVIPLVLFVLIMMNTMTQETNEYMNDQDTTRIERGEIDTLNTESPDDILGE
jgi:uncharacterized membrane protein